MLKLFDYGTPKPIIITRQNQQLSDLSMRRSQDGQIIPNVTEQRLLGLTFSNKFQWQAQIRHMQINVPALLFVWGGGGGSSSSAVTYYKHRHQKPLLQNSYKTHRLCVNSDGWL